MQQHCHHQRFTDVSARARQHGILPVPCMGLHSKTLFLTGVHSHSHTANHLPSSARQQHNPTGNNLSSHSRQPSALVGAGRDVPGAPAEQPSSSQESGQPSSGSIRAEAAGQVAAPPPPRPPISADAAQQQQASPSTSPSPSSVPAVPSPSPNALASVEISDYPSDFPMHRLLVFAGITAGYMGLYFTRGSLNFCSPLLLADPSLGMSITDIGAMTSAFPLAYGFSKFAGGVLGARFSARLMLGGGLLLTAFVNVAFGFSYSVPVFTALWFLNGSLQGIGAPASAALLTSWFASKERGTYWGLWNVGANLGGFITPLVVGYVANHYGWRWGMWAPGALGLAIALFTLAVVRDSPTAAGYMPASVAAAAELNQQPADAKKPGSNANMKEALVQVMRNPGVWLLALTYFFVYVIRQGATSWLMMYLLQTKGAANAAAAAFTVSGLELGGLLGSTLAGFVSDARVRSATALEQQGSSAAGTVGRRVQVVMGYVAATLLALLALKHVPVSSQPLQWLVIAFLGFTIYGPQMLIGLCGAELVAKTSVGASQGLLGLVSYMGAANAGIPLSYVLKHHGWDGYFMVMAASSVAALLLLVPLANAPSFVQLQRRQAQKAA